MNRLFALTLFSIFIVPISCWIPIQGVTIWYTQFIMLFSVFCFGISLLIWRLNWAMSLFTMVCLFSAIFVSRQHPKALVMLIQVDLACLAIYAISLFSEKQRKAILWSIFGLAVLQGIYVVIQYFNMDPMFDKIVTGSITDKTADDTVGFSGSHNQSGLLFAVTLPIIMDLFPYIIPLSFFGLFCSTTTSAVFGAIIGTGFYLGVKNKKALLCFVLILAAITQVYFTKFEKFSMKPVVERYLVARHSIEAVVRGNIRIYSLIMTQFPKMVRVPRVPDGVVTVKPWLGYGFGNFSRISPYSQLYINSAHRYSHAHNDLVEVFFELGLPGLIAALLVILQFIWLFIKSRKTRILKLSMACLFTHFICSFGMFSVHTAVSGMILIIYVGLFMGEIRDNAK